MTKSTEPASAIAKDQTLIFKSKAQTLNFNVNTC